MVPILSTFMMPSSCLIRPRGNTLAHPLPIAPILIPRESTSRVEKVALAVDLRAERDLNIFSLKSLLRIAGAATTRSARGFREAEKFYFRSDKRGDVLEQWEMVSEES